jgi:hypothetical protein
MKNAIHALRIPLLVAATTMFCAAPAFAAQPQRPTVCARYSVLKSDGAKLLVCLDGKRPSVWAGPWGEVQLAGHTYAFGFRSAQ